MRRSPFVTGKQRYQAAGNGLEHDRDRNGNNKYYYQTHILMVADESELVQGYHRDALKYIDAEDMLAEPFKDRIIYAQGILCVIIF